jgi:hypothetical protein
MKRIKEGEYGLCILNTCMNMEHWNCQSHFKKGKGEEKEGDEPNQGTLYIYTEIAQQIPLYN